MVVSRAVKNKESTKPEQLDKDHLLRDSKGVYPGARGGGGMALSMDEQRVLAEIERRLAAEDPGLASCMTSFRRPGPSSVLRSPRARIIGSLFTVLLVALVSLMVYAMIPFRGHGARSPAGNTPYASSTSAASTRAADTQPKNTTAQSTAPNAATGMKATKPSTSATGNGQAASTSSTNRSPLPVAGQESRQSWTR
jgi:hypothetical protein